MNEVATLIMMAVWNAKGRAMSLNELAQHQNVKHINSVMLALGVQHLEETGELTVTYKLKDKNGNIGQEEWNEHTDIPDEQCKQAHDLITWLKAS